jgi:isoleucyl-tRNA synthetase
VTERVWQDIVRPVTPDAPESVHLSSWPEPNPAAVDDELAGQVALARRLVELGRAARAESKVRTRQPLARALIGARGWDDLDDELCWHIADELNVVELASLDSIGHELVDVSAKANFRSLGRRFGANTPAVAAAIAATDARALARDLQAGPATLDVAGIGQVDLADDDVVITETPRHGWAVAREGETVALDLTLTDELVRTGLAREFVRLVQEARKATGFEVTDRIELAWSADGETAAALREHTELIAGEVLAVVIHDSLEPLAAEPDHTDADLGLRFRLRRAPNPLR